MNREQIIETMARAICAAEMFPHPWEEEGESGQWFFLEQATAALSALEAAGLVLVPVDPTDAMLEAGAFRDEYSGAVYAAMIKAAQENKP